MTGPVTGTAEPDRARSLRLEHVGVEIGGRTALGGIELELQSGAPVALTGPSGSGKTVLCLVLAGALAPTRGRVLLDGRPLSSIAAPVGLVLQHHGLVAGLTAQENVALPLQDRRMPRRVIEDRVGLVLDAVGLAAHRTRLVDELSGGERQRVGMARALAGDPAILVADEPTSELDPENRTRVLSLLSEHAAAGRIVVVASDDPEVVGAFPRVVSLHHGVIA